MYKNKDGKVIASLTEVKNKTGDIFAIVDEFGEIALTSYNKVRYKIIKVDIENSVEINEDGPEAKVATTEKRRVGTPKLEQRNEPIVEEVKPVEVKEVEPVKAELPEIKPEPVEIKPEPAPEPVKEEPKEKKLFEKVIDIQVWNRDGRDERQFSLNAIRPLIS